MKKFDDLDYTRESIIKQLLLIQNHGVDGSAVDAGCGCIEDKHLFVVEALAEEGETIATNPKEKEFYASLADLARNLRRKIDAEDWNIHGVMRETMRARSPEPQIACVRCLETHSKAECVELGVCKAK